MQIEFKNAYFKHKRLIKKVFECAMEITGNKIEDVRVSVSFVSANEIQKLNMQHREIDRVTDVLSFPMLDIRYPKKLGEFDEERAPNGDLFLGDIVICHDKAKQQAKEYGNSNKRELVFLALHGFLHLLGYDHIESTDENIMQSIAENVMLNFNIKRGKHE